MKFFSFYLWLLNNYTDHTFQTRYPQLQDPERLRSGIDEFIDKVYQTDVVLLYSPSQIALAAILYAASNAQENLDMYVTDTLFGLDKQYLTLIIEVVRSK